MKNTTRRVFFMQVAPTASLVIPSEILENARVVLNQVIAQIPQSTQGLERQIFIGDFVEKLPLENRQVLKNFVECLLLRMFLIAKKTPIRRFLWRQPSATTCKRNPRSGCSRRAPNCRTSSAA